jgi:hypothetical protein
VCAPTPAGCLSTAASSATTGTTATATGNSRALLALAGGGFLAAAVCFFAFTADDSYIAFRYGRNIAAGLGPVFDAQPPREGHSSPLWVALSALPFLFHLSADAAAFALKCAGLALGAASVALTAQFVRRRTQSERAATGAALLIACMPWFAFWSVGGLETPLYCALLMWGLLLHERENQQRRSHLAAAFPLALLAFTRPEGIAVALAVLAADPVVLAVRRNAQRRGALKQAAPALVIVCGCWILYEAWRVTFYGALFPSTFQAKAGLTAHDLKTRAVEMLPFLIYVAPLLVAAALARAARRGLSRAARPGLSRDARGGWTRAAWGAALVQAAFIVVPRLETGPGYRYEVPLLPLLAAAAATGLDHAIQHWRIRVPVRFATAALMLFLLTPLVWLRSPARFSPSPAEVSFGRWLASYAPDARLAVYDLGAVPYYSSAPWVFDTNPAGPLNPFLGRAYDVDALLAWSPWFIILPPNGDAPAADPLARVAALPSFTRDYAVLFDLDGGEGYRLIVWKRRDVQLPDGALAAAEAAGLYQRRVSRSAGGSPKYS